MVIIVEEAEDVEVEEKKEPKESETIGRRERGAIRRLSSKLGVSKGPKQNLGDLRVKLKYTVPYISIYEVVWKD